MKKLYFFSLIILGLTFNGCLKDKCESVNTFTQWTPIYKTDEEFREAPQYQAARALKNPGKIYFYDNYILINEIKEGVHIIDNSNVLSPRNVGFIKIVGNIDIAIKDDVLYADSHADLLAISIANIQQPRLVKRTQDVFPNLFWRDPIKGWVVDYKQEKVTQKIDCNDPRINNGGGWFERGDVLFSSSSSFPSAGTKSSGAKPAGVGGSMARFTLYSDYLYTISQAQVKVFNVKKVDNPVLSNSINVAWDIETLFPYTDKLFIGSTTGMYIFDLVNPTNPTLLSNFTHGRACDPVVVEGNRAYVTLRDGTPCNNGINQLLIVDISNLRSPQLLKSYQMKNPRGLSVMDSTLYLCDDGFKIFDVTEWSNVDKNQKSHITNFDTFDVIAFRHTDTQKVAMVIGKDGFYQFDVTNPEKPKELSKIPVVAQ
jgi:hypothetical protein